MNARDVVVRIVQPAENHRAQKLEPAQAPVREKLRQGLNLLVICGLCVLGISSACGLLAFGLALRDIVVMISIPLTIGLITTYAIG
jgi:hypothetical protein